MSTPPLGVVVKPDTVIHVGRGSNPGVNTWTREYRSFEIIENDQQRIEMAAAIPIRCIKNTQTIPKIEKMKTDTNPQNTTK